MLTLKVAIAEKKAAKESTTNAEQKRGQQGIPNDKLGSYLVQKSPSAVINAFIGL